MSVQVRPVAPGERGLLEAVLVAEDASHRLVGFAEVSRRTWAEGCDTSPVGFLEGWYVEPAQPAAGRGPGAGGGGGGVGALEGLPRIRVGHAIRKRGRSLGPSRDRLHRGGAAPMFPEGALARNRR